ncbi:Craniofacial development protein 2 [Lucilia cuprina]|nr:Craniofacial development protein 2 [Lucilia cuprina]
MDERLATIRIRSKFFNISLICAHAPTEDKDEVAKNRFYDRLDELYDRCPKNDVKIVLGDVNAKIGKENVFGPTVEKFSLHDETTKNGMRLVN